MKMQKDNVVKDVEPSLVNDYIDAGWKEYKEEIIEIPMISKKKNKNWGE